MSIVDSKKQMLSFPEIIVNALASYGFKGEEFTKAALLTMEEIKMKGCEARNVCNTVFICHFTPDRRTAMLKVLNADTHANLLNNVQTFLEQAKENGTDLFVYFHDDKSPMPIFNYIEKQRIGVTQTEQNSKGQFATLINLDPNPDHLQEQGIKAKRR